MGLHSRVWCWLGFLCVSVAVVQAAPPLPFLPWQAIQSFDAESALGESVAIDGDVLVVGMPHWRYPTLGHPSRIGGIRIFRWVHSPACSSLGRGGACWWHDRIVDLEVLGPGGQQNGRFGASVAVSGNRILVGCPGCSGTRPNAYLIDVPEPGTTHTPVWYPVAAPMTSPADAQQGIGAAVALVGNMLAVGAPRATFGVPEFGGVSVGRFDGSQVVWEDTRYGWTDSRFGSALAIARTRSAGALPLFSHTVVVGAPQYVQSGVFGVAGRAMLLHRSSAGDWSAGQVFDNPDTGLVDAMGTAVAIHRPSVDGNAYVALGAHGRGANGVLLTGTVRMYTRDAGTGQYAFSQEIQHPEANAYDRFGEALALAGDRLVVGAGSRTVGMSADAGSVYVYERRFVPVPLGYRWQLQQMFPAIQNSGDAGFGRAVALSSGNALVVGAPRYDSSNTPDAGLVVAYLCDRIFSNGLQAGASNACNGP